MHDMSANIAQKRQHYNKPNNNMLDNRGSRNSFGGDKNVICQICFIPRQNAYKCINRFNHAFIPWQGRGNPGCFRPRGGQFFGGNYGRGFGRGFNGGFSRLEPYQGYVTC